MLLGPFKPIPEWHLERKKVLLNQTIKKSGVWFSKQNYFCFVFFQSPDRIIHFK
jgi:hypothetical protein